MAPASGEGLGDVSVLYCAQVYAETAALLDQDSGADLRGVAEDARVRSQALGERDHDLLNTSPARHSRASTVARQRLAALPEKPGRARSVALRSAYEECRGLEDRAMAAPVTGKDRVQMLARRHFCRDLLLSKLQVSPKLRAGFTPSELATLEEIQKVGEALARPLPGDPPTLEQDREAKQLSAKFRADLDLAVANWSAGQDPVVQAMGQCHDDYAQGLLGGPAAPGGAGEASATAPVVTEATAAAALAPVMKPANLGPVFHMREVTPAGTFHGLWFRRGRSPLYDAVWVQANSGQMQRDVLELRGIVDGELTLYRQGFRGSYRARVLPDGTLAPGAASWFDNAAYSWTPLPAQAVRTGSGDLGAIVHMREVTPQGNYEGIWRQRGQTGVYDVIWVFLPTGEVTADVLAVTGAAKGQLLIQRQDGPGLYPLKRRTPSPRQRNAGKGGIMLSRWEVLPAQPVRLGGPTR